MYDAPTGTTTIVNHITYDAYGQILTQTDPAFTTLFAFTARPYDAATGLQNNHHRWYDAATGRWLSEDPIAFAAGDANLYRYVDNRPTNAADPRGTQPPDPFSVGDYSYSTAVGQDFDPMRRYRYLNFGPDGTGVVVFETNDADPSQVPDLHRIYGPRVRAHKNVASLQEMVQTIREYPDGSIQRLIIAGHNRAAGCGASVAGGYNVGSVPKSGLPRILPDEKELVLHLSARSMVGENAAVIRQKLAEGAVVEIRSCYAGANESSMEFLANNLQATVRASTGNLYQGGAIDGEWRIVPVTGPPFDHPADRR